MEILPCFRPCSSFGDSPFPGLLNKSLEVEEGQAALLFLNGRHDTTLTPGKYSLGNVLTGRGGDASVVLCRRCFQESSIGTKFCPNCGETLMAQPGSCLLFANSDTET